MKKESHSLCLKSVCSINNNVRLINYLINYLIGHRPLFSKLTTNTRKISIKLNQS